jgi:hypothetical protein
VYRLRRGPGILIVVSEQANARGQQRDVLAPLAAEDHSCPVCGMTYSAVSVDQAVEAIGQLPAAVQEAVSRVSMEARRLRPAPDQWSVTEYACHLRDVYVVYTIRLHRARTEHRPVLEPMLNDLRARRFRYNEFDANAVLAEIAATAVGFCEEVARNQPHHWNRLVTRLPGEIRTSRWLVRQAMHEGQHHLYDIRRTTAAVAADAGRERH